MDFLATPIKNHVQNEPHQLSVIDSPPILKSDEEQININESEHNDKNTNSSDTSEVDGKINEDQDHLSHVEGYPHGLSAKKKITRVYFSLEGKDRFGDNDCDMSIELGRNNSDIKSDSEQNSSSDYNSNPNTQNKSIDSNNNDLTNSSIEIKKTGKELQDTVTTSNGMQYKRDGEELFENDGEHSNKKVKLDNALDLHKNDQKKDNSIVTNNDIKNTILDTFEYKANNVDQHIENPFQDNSTHTNPQITSPIQIELVETKTEDIKPEDYRKNADSSEKDHELLDEPFDASHKLTPIAHQAVSNYDIIDGDIDIDSIGKRNDELNDQIFSLNQRINLMHVLHEKLKVELKQLKFTNDMINEEKQKLQEQVQNHHDELQKKNENMNYELNNLRSELSSLQSNQTLLQGKYDQIYNENIKLQNAKDMLSNEIDTLQKSLSDSADILEDLTAHNKDLEDKLNQLTNAKLSIENERNEFNKELRRIITQLDGKDNEIATLEGKVRELIEHEKNHSKDLIDQIANLSKDKMSLEERIKKSENSYKTETQYLKDTIDEKEQQLADLKEQINKTKENKVELEKSLKEKNNELDVMKRNFEETNDNATIKTAEVSELNKEIEKLKEDKLQSEVNLSKLEEQIQEWENKYKEEVEIKQQLHIELESLQEKITKEAIVEASNTNIINSAEYQKLKEENEKLKRAQENNISALPPSIDDSALEMYKQQIENLKRKLEQREADTTKRLRKLSEDLYVQYSSKHEQKVKLLKKNYETKFKGEIERLTQENIALQQEVEQLNEKLSIGRREKQELLKALEDK
ncbi:Slk19p PWA37_005305 [Arxiozyma heterogenica]|uniref:Slk19p n=1 Tax=Arxiozyma heterogenica TaxID=278026 RepID=UPI002EF86A8B